MNPAGATSIAIFFAGKAAAAVNAASVVEGTLMTTLKLARRAQKHTSHAEKPMPFATICLT